MRKRKCKLNDVQTKKVIELYISGLSANTIADEYQISHATVLNILKRASIDRRSTSEKLKLKIDESYFEVIDSEEKAYWLGFIMADGCVYKNAFVIRLADKDKKHLYRLKLALKSHHLIGLGTKDGHKFAQFQVKSPKLVSDLSKWGIVERKSGKEIIPNISPKLIHHFLRGYFDGDGWITFKKAYRNPDRLDWTFGIVSASLNILLSIKNIINTECSNNYGYIEERNYVNLPHYSLCFGGNSCALDVLTYLYSDSNIFLERKYKRFIKLKKQQAKSKKQNRHG